MRRGNPARPGPSAVAAFRALAASGAFTALAAVAAPTPAGLSPPDVRRVDLLAGVDVEAVGDEGRAAGRGVVDVTAQVEGPLDGVAYLAHEQGPQVPGQYPSAHASASFGAVASREPRELPKSTLLTEATSRPQG